MATQTEIYKTIIDAMSDNEEVVAFCEKKLAALAKKTAREEEKAKESQKFRDDIVAVLDAAEGPLSAKDIAEEMGAPSRKVAANMTYVVKSGRAEKVKEPKSAAFKYVVAVH